MDITKYNLNKLRARSSIDYKSYKENMCPDVTQDYTACVNLEYQEKDGVSYNCCSLTESGFCTLRCFHENCKMFSKTICHDSDNLS